MKAGKKSLSEMSLEHKKRVFNAWQQMTYETVKGLAVANVFCIGLCQIEIDIKIYVGSSGFKRAVNDLLKAFINCQVEYKVSYYIDDDTQRKYIRILAKA